MTITATQEIKVNLDDYQKKRVTIDYMCEQADWKQSYYINEDDDWVYDNKECHTTHSFEIQERIRKANREDKIINEIFKNHFFNF